MTGVQMIAAERARQVARGWTAAHDDEHTDGSLLAFARMMVTAVEEGYGLGDFVSGGDWVRKYVGHALEKHPDSIARLKIAGALIAAEIDRLQRLER